MYDFISGAICFGCLGISIFYFKFWRKAGDRLFAYFATSFAILFIERIVLVTMGSHHEQNPKIYFIRLIAFLIILLGIYSKNAEKGTKVNDDQVGRDTPKIS
jgi:Na+/melibiose symporter-like transporter